MKDTIELMEKKNLIYEHLQEAIVKSGGCFMKREKLDQFEVKELIHMIACNNIKIDINNPEPIHQPREDWKLKASESFLNKIKKLNKHYNIGLTLREAQQLDEAIERLEWAAREVRY